MISKVTKTIGGNDYSLRSSPVMPWSKTIGKSALQILALPLMVPAGLAVFIAMATPLRNTLLSIFIPRIMKVVDKEFHEERQALLSGVSGNVLDVGSGAGAYLQYCKSAACVVAVEPVELMHAKIREAGKDLKSLVIVKDLSDVDKSISFDWVIFGNVLCEVPCVEDTIRRVDKILKPGGRVYFSEHIARSKGDWRRSFQDFINPMWRHMGGGCNCNRDSINTMRTVTNWEVAYWSYEHIQVVMGPFVMGLAVKRKNTN